MRKSLRRALWAGAIVAVASAAIPMVQASAAATCAPAWSSSAIYVKDNKLTIDKLLVATAKSQGLESIKVLGFHRLQLGQ